MHLPMFHEYQVPQGALGIFCDHRTGDRNVVSPLFVAYLIWNWAKWVTSQTQILHLSRMFEIATSCYIHILADHPHYFPIMCTCIRFPRFQTENAHEIMCLDVFADFFLKNSWVVLLVLTSKGVNQSFRKSSAAQEAKHWDFPSAPGLEKAAPPAPKRRPQFGFIIGSVIPSGKRLHHGVFHGIFDVIFDGIL